MSSNTQDTGTFDGSKETLDNIKMEKCIVCSSSFSSSVFSPYCSMKCAKDGVRKRYSLLRSFVDFESKYINPPEKQDLPKDNDNDIGSSVNEGSGDQSTSKR